MQLRSRRAFLAGTGGLAVAAFAGFRLAPPTQVLAQDAIAVTTTVGFFGDLVQNVGGDRVAVTALMGPGIDPHLYKPSSGDVERLAGAEIIFYGGLHLEGRLTDTLEGIARSGKPVVAITDGIPEESLIPVEGGFDPHFWFDVSLTTSTVETIATALSEQFGDSAEAVATNAATYLTRLSDLDTYVREQAMRVPEQQRVLVTAHDAFGYFGRAYGFEVRGIQGISTASEAGTGDIQELIDFIVQRQIPAIFVESSVPPNTIEAVQQGAAAQGWDVTIGGQLYSDAAGDAGTDQATYIGMVTHNIDTIVGALLGEEHAPEAEASPEL